MKEFAGLKYKVIGGSDWPYCDKCGKTNLTRSLDLEDEHGETYTVGYDCASKMLRQVYQGKKYPLSIEGLKSVVSVAKKTGNHEVLEMK